MDARRALLVAALIAVGPHPVSSRGRAADTSPAAVTGRVRSPDGDSMEGVLVGLRRDGSTVTTTVATDENGRYTFPASRLEAGRYGVRIRAVGYDLESP